MTVADDNEIPGQLPLFEFPEPDKYTEPAEENVPDDDQNRSDLDDVRKANMQKMLELRSISAQLKRPIMPDPSGVLMTRFNALLDMLLTDSARTAFELEFERRMAPQLDAIVAQARQLLFTDGVTGSNGHGGASLIVPGQ